MSMFLSYRRADSQEVVGRIFDYLKAYYPPARIFRDLDSILLGKPFPQAIRAALSRVKTVLVIIGPNWASITNSNGGFRLDDPTDYVRIEVELALSLDALVIPVLVSRAAMPKAEMLPSALRPLVSLQAAEVPPDPFFDYGMQRLLYAIEKAHGYRLPDSPRNEWLERLAKLMDRCDSPPFGRCLRNMMDPFDRLQDVLHYNELIPRDAEPGDPNESMWATVKPLAGHDSIDGFWSSRWRLSPEPGIQPESANCSAWQEGTALIRAQDDWAFIEYEDNTNKYVIRARRIDDMRLAGRYINCTLLADTTPWVGIIVDNCRIDGFWSGRCEGRWDFRRQ
jgi:hypothetical protein